MEVTSFKSEVDAFAIPPKFVAFDWTLENYKVVQERSDYVRHAINSIVLSLGSTLVALVFAIPAAWGMAFAPTRRTRGTLLWNALHQDDAAGRRALLDAEPDHVRRRAAHDLHRAYSSPEGLFWAKLSAASTLAIAPILVLGWLSQRQLVRGLTFGAVK